MTTKATPKKRKQNLLQGLIRLLVMVGVADLVLVLLWLNGRELSPDDLPAGTADFDLAVQLEALAERDTGYQPLVDHPESYPEELLSLAAGNPETLQFVLDYPANKDTPAAESIEELRAGEIPQLLQWDERWGYTMYGEHTLAVTGCGPTCLSMVASGLTGDNTLTPAVVADWSENHGHYVNGSGSSWSLMTKGAEHFGLTSTELPLDESRMKSELAAGHPIICSVREGDFTTSGHFIVLHGVEDDKFQVYDPNSQTLSHELWDYDTLAPQIRNLWAFAAA